jgi:hypothetical protein
MRVEQGGDGLRDGAMGGEWVGHERIEPCARRTVKKDKMS